MNTTDFAARLRLRREWLSSDQGRAFLGTQGRAAALSEVVALEQWLDQALVAEADLAARIWTCSACGVRHTPAFDTCGCGERARWCNVCEEVMTDGDLAAPGEAFAGGVCRTCWANRPDEEAEIIEDLPVDPDAAERGAFAGP